MRLSAVCIGGASLFVNRNLVRPRYAAPNDATMLPWGSTGIQCGRILAGNWCSGSLRSPCLLRELLGSGNAHTGHARKLCIRKEGGSGVDGVEWRHNKPSSPPSAFVAVAAARHYEEGASTVNHNTGSCPECRAAATYTRRPPCDAPNRRAVVGSALGCPHASTHRGSHRAPNPNDSPVAWLRGE